MSTPVPAVHALRRHADGSENALALLHGMSRWAAALVCLLALFIAAPATAAEVINNFASNVSLRTDGSVAVTEVIDVTSEGIEIRRGIYRDIPTFMINPDGSRLRSSLSVQSVDRNGRSEPYSVEQLGNGFVRIRIGDADIFLEDGRHRYTIRYTMTRMARQFENHDELYWNATGNYWSFPILNAVAAVTLPEGAVIADLAGYTGEVGSTETAVTINRTSDNTATFRATRTLAAGEGLTVAAMFQKGIIPEPSGTERLIWWISDHRDLIYPLVAVVVVLLYYLLAWSAVGRDPARGTIIPLFHPPRGFSPALVHYVHRMGWDKGGWTAFTASIFDLGVKGLVVIDNVKKTLKVTVTGKQPDVPLPPGEKLLFDYLSSKGSVTVNTTNGPKLNETRRDFVSILETENRQVYFKNHTGYVLAGLALSLAAIGALVLLDVVRPLYLILAVVGGIAIGLFAGMFKRVVAGDAGSIFIAVVWAFIALANFGTGLLSWLSDFRIDTAVVGAASIVVINVIFAVLMRAPTVQGRKVMDQIDGLRMYLRTAEENRLNMEGEPPMTVERFERLLPFAIALDVEKPWSEHFEAELKRNAVADAAGGAYHPTWYHGSDWSSSRGGFSSAVNAATTGMAAAMIAAQPASSSSSGFSGGGGGSSGGGGGGGGGGGW
jgi:uncharacterized membrane protein YgcG